MEIGMKNTWNYEEVMDGEAWFSSWSCSSSSPEEEEEGWRCTRCVDLRVRAGEKMGATAGEVKEMTRERVGRSLRGLSSFENNHEERLNIISSSTCTPNTITMYFHQLIPPPPTEYSVPSVSIVSASHYFLYLATQLLQMRLTESTSDIISFSLSDWFKALNTSCNQCYVIVSSSQLRKHKQKWTIFISFHLCNSKFGRREG